MLRKTLEFLVIFSLILGLFLFNRKITSEKTSKPDRCILCHEDIPSPDKNHDISAIGCSSCHLGNPYALDKKLAHEYMVKNPANYPYISITCGKSNCHPDQVKRVKNSLMATNRGIINTLRYQWGESETSYDTMTIYNLTGYTQTLAISHFRKFCSTCHIWKKLGDLPGEIGTRGGGCIDCHIEKKPGHIGFTVKITSDKCTKCHNRSARTGLSYIGLFESEGYGTPFSKGRPDKTRRLSGNRYYRNLLPDIHFEYKLQCIDCHTSIGLMGDGKAYSHAEEQVEISCEDCHSPIFGEVTPEDSALILARLNGLKLRPGDKVAISRRSHFPLYNVQLINGKTKLVRKIDGEKITIVKMSENPYHTMHENLSCQACHSAWIPQCYGCHDIYQKNLKQLDKITYRKTAGKWEERRSYLRYEHPQLMIGKGGKVYPAAPGCQVYLYVVNSKGGIDSSSNHFTISFFDPHTTRRAVRACQDCHLNPKTVGLGTGNLYFNGDSIEFIPIYDSERSGLKIPLESLIDTRNRPIQRPSRETARFFTLDEIKKILTVGFCTQCHTGYDNKIYENFKLSMEKFRSGACPARQK